MGGLQFALVVVGAIAGCSSGTSHRVATASVHDPADATPSVVPTQSPAEVLTVDASTDNSPVPPPSDAGPPTNERAVTPLEWLDLTFEQRNRILVTTAVEIFKDLGYEVSARRNTVTAKNDACVWKLSAGDGYLHIVEGKGSVWGCSVSLASETLDKEFERRIGQRPMVGAPASSGSSGGGLRCTVGCPCGNSCIDCSKRCRK